MVALVAVAVAGLFLILNRTRLGMRIRAGTLDLETVSVLGVNVRILRNLNFGLGIYLAGLAGVLAAGMLGLQPTIGTSLIMPSFVAIIVGGLGSLPGTLLGGLLIGVASGITTVFFPSATEAVMYVMMGPGAAGPAARPARRRRDGSIEARAAGNCTAARHLAAAAHDAVLDGRARRLYRARHPRAGAWAGGDVAQLPARVHRRAVVRPRRLFRPRRLRRRHDPQIPCAEHAAWHPGRRRRRSARCRTHRRADRAAARRLFRHGDDRLRPGVLFHRVPLELG